ncbi:MAG: HDIG domain-containing protein, partial [bacterium]|nr:HDIG domain-containing protein [bacterium]
MFKRLALLWKTHRSAAGSRLKRILFGLIIWGLITGVLFADLDSSKVFLQNGDVAKRDILAPKTISYTTFGIRSRAEILNDIETLFVYLANDSKADLDSTMKGRQLWDELEERPALLEYLTSLEPEQLHLLRDQVQALIIPYMNRGIPEDEFDTYREQIAKEIGSLELETNSQELLLTLTAKLLKDLPKKKTIKKGEIIIRHGDRATPEDIYVLKELGLYGIEARRRLNILGGGLVSLLLFASVFLFMYRFRPKVLESDSLLAMVGIVAVVSLALSKMVLILSHSGVYFRGMNIFSPYLCPLSTASMLITILIGADMGILLTVVLSVLIGLMEIEGIKLTITLFFGGLAGIMAVSRVSQRADIIRAGFYVSLAHVFFLLGLYLFKAEAAFSTFSQPLFRDIITGFVGGFTATILTIGGLPYLENFFKITTSIKLLEFSDLNQPLMQELLVKAPGTYHHSIVVANMAEASAEMIGADPLLCKIGGYYHDIGKLKRPYFFVENQIGIENQHESLSPYLSTLIISSHVKDGIELAKKYNLASPIIDIVAQHQGTGLITYFYHRAREQAADPDEVREEEFRYPGPKPHSKEAALVMLA